MLSEKTKKCNGCKKTIFIDYFTYENKEYARCNDCRKQAIEKYKKNVCEVCGIIASFNIPDLKWGRFCKEHSQVGMIDVRHKKCIIESCNKRPNYNYENKKEAIYCKEHSQVGMIDINHKTCIYKGCKKRPNFNYKGENDVLYCKEHSKEKMVCVKSKICIFDDCNKQPTFNYENESVPLYCKEHSEEKMVDVKSSKCKEEGCNKRPTFNYEIEKKALYCKEHSKENMVDVKNKKCIFEGCNKIPTFNYQGYLKALYCKEHSKLDMINVKHKKCIIKGCTTISTFNYKGETKPLYCKEHSKENMVDVITNKCIIFDCNTTATYGYCGQSKTHCSKHKEKIMFNTPKRTCIGNDEEECKDMAIYGIKTPVHCEEHCSKDEICLIASKCKQCERTELLNKEGICITFCSPNKLYEEHKSQQKVKETTMIKYLDTFIKSEYKVKDDTIIDSFCNLYRPDRIYDCNTHFVVIECDEYQHKKKQFCSSYKDLKHAELSRMHEIQNACGLPCIFLRWNPDSFRIKGILNKKYNMKERLKLLVKWVEKCFTMNPDKEELVPVKYKYLFYDEYEESDLTFLEIDDTKLI